MKTLFSFFLLLLFTLSRVQADAPPAPAPALPPVGIIILKAVAGYDAAATWFVSIQWVNKDSGFVIDASGNKLPFLNDAIGSVIYFDEAYYDQVDHNQYWVEWRIVMRDREVVLTPVTPQLLRTGDSAHLASEQALFQDDIQLYPNAAPVLQPLIDTLKDEIAKLNSGLLYQDGKWTDAKDAAAVTDTVPVIGDSEPPVTFTTTTGKRFENARVTVTDTGLSVLTSDGGASVAFNTLPQDISAFPKDVQDKINARRASDARVAVAAAAAAVPPPPSTETSVQNAATSAFNWLTSMYNEAVNYFYPPKAANPSAPAPAPAQPSHS